MFAEKKQRLLADLRMVAIRHNRDYYESIIPFVESADESSEDLIDAYREALDADKNHLMQSRKALGTVEAVEGIIL